MVGMRKITTHGKSIRLIGFGFVFAVFYWILESVRDVLILEEGNLLERIFMPDTMSFWMRFLVVCLIILFSLLARSMKHNEDTSIEKRPRIVHMCGIVVCGLGIAVLYWILESVRDVIIFQKGNMMSRLLSPEPMSLWMRLLAVGILLLFSIYVQSVINMRKRTEDALRKGQESLERKVHERTSDLSKSNVLLKQAIEKRDSVVQELNKVNRILKTLSEGNKAVVHATEEIELLNKVCHILVDVGGYPFVWVGFTEQNEEKSIYTVTKAGKDDGYLDVVNFTWSETDLDGNPIGKAIWSGEPFLVKDQSGDQKNYVWYKEAVKRGFSSSISLPLLKEGWAFGALNIYATNHHAFTPAEIKLLREMTEDLAFGVITLRTRAEHKTMEEEKNIVEKQLIQAQKMEEVGVLTGGIAHDFNNLLTAILGCADLSLMKIDENNELNEDLKEIHKIARKGADTVRQLLLFSRKHSMEFTTIDLKDVIHDLGKMFDRLIGEDIKLSSDFLSDLWCIRADRGMIEQVMMNLVVNARDAMPSGGCLRIRADNRVLGEEDCIHGPQTQVGKYVCLSVSDTGHGIDQQIVQRIFESFFTTKESGKGTGLGLSVVYGIVRQHKGWVHVSSRPGRGSVFEIFLPAAIESIEPEAEVIVNKESDHGIGKRILMVEDEEKILEYMSEGLTRCGYKVTRATSAKDAVAAYESEKGDFCAVCSDVVLPDGDGLELVNKLLLRNPYIGIVLSSGYTDHKSRWQTIQEKGFRFLQKPYTLNRLLHVLRQEVESIPR